jgi:hypothetical protein
LLAARAWHQRMSSQANARCGGQRLSRNPCTRKGHVQRRVQQQQQPRHSPATAACLADPADRLPHAAQQRHAQRCAVKAWGAWCTPALQLPPGHRNKTHHRPCHVHGLRMRPSQPPAKHRISRRGTTIHPNLAELTPHQGGAAWKCSTHARRDVHTPKEPLGAVAAAAVAAAGQN